MDPKFEAIFKDEFPEAYERAKEKSASSRAKDDLEDIEIRVLPRFVWRTVATVLFIGAVVGLVLYFAPNLSAVPSSGGGSLKSAISKHGGPLDGVGKIIDKTSKELKIKESRAKFLWEDKPAFK